MNTLYTTLLFILFGQNIILGQYQTLRDSILNNEISFSRIESNEKNKVDFEPYSETNPFSNDIIVDCEEETEFIVQVGDSLYIYNIMDDSFQFLTEEIHGIAASFGYLYNDEKLAASADWDSLYYFDNSNWTFSGYSGSGNSELVHLASGIKSTYLMGAHLWFFNGVDDPKLIRENINYSVADLAVDERENVWVITRTNWPIADTLRIIDSTGLSLCDLPFEVPIHTGNGYGMMIFDGKVVVGFGPNNPNFPNSLVPLEVNEAENTVSFGLPILENLAFNIDLGGCSKEINFPACELVNSRALHFQKRFTISPNPFSDELIIVADALAKTEAEVRIFDLFGKLLFFEKYNLENQAKINTEFLPAGLLILNISVAGNQFSTKLVKTP